MPSIDPYLRLAIERNARQFVLLPDEKPALHFDTGTVTLGKEVSALQIAKGLGEILPENLRESLHKRQPAEWSYVLNGVAFRIQTSPRPAGLGATFTLTGPSAPPPDAHSPRTLELAAAELEAEAPTQGGNLGFEHYIRSLEVCEEEYPINRHLLKMMEMGASDVHLCARCRPMYRIDGEMREDRMAEPLSAQELVDLLFQVAPADSFDDFQEHGSCDFAYEMGDQARFRVNVFKEYRGLSAVFRRIPQVIPSAEELRLPPSVRMLAMLPKGLVLVTGPTGSGKSTTLASLLDLANRSRADHIITVEQPIEFIHHNKKCLVHQREVGIHTGGFSEALHDALREDPDIVLVGEMRDLETISMAIETAATGHLVFGTLHTTTAVNTIDRVIEMFPSDRQAQVRTMLADSLKAVICQNLLKKNGGGRVATMEVLLVTPSVSNLIREHKTHQITNIMQTSRSHGMQQMNDDLVRLVREKQVEPMEAYKKAIDKQDLLRLFERNGVAFRPPADLTLLQDEGNGQDRN